MVGEGGGEVWRVVQGAKGLGSQLLQEKKEEEARKWDSVWDAYLR